MSHRDAVRDFLLDPHPERHLADAYSLVGATPPSHPNKELEGDDEYWNEYEWDDEDDIEDEDEDEQGDDPTENE